MFSIVVSSRAKHGIEKVPEELLPKIGAAIDALEKSFYPEQLDVKKLKGLGHTYRIRSGGWHIIYIVDFREKRIFIIDCLPRKLAYKK